MDHVIPNMPPWTGRLRYPQLVLSVLYLGLMGGSLAVLNVGYGVDSYYYGGLVYFVGQAFGIFVGGWSFIFLISVIVTTRSAQGGYLKWFHLGAESLTVVFWLIAMALTANDAASLQVLGYGIYNPDAVSTSIYGMLAAGAFFAAVNLVLFLLTFIMLAIGCHNYRISQPPPANIVMVAQVPAQQPYHLYDTKLPNVVNTAPPPGHQSFHHHAPVTMPPGLA